MRHGIALIAATLMLMGSVGGVLHAVPVKHPTRNCIVYHHCHR